jgi:peptidoglycan/LPS O-acetylase OafA/YrhL
LIALPSSEIHQMRVPHRCSNESDQETWLIGFTAAVTSFDTVGQSGDGGVSIKLGREFDPRNNALNAWRLTLATGVILWHSFPLTGRHVAFEPAHQLLGQVFVDGFFAISGFLITGSWLSNPRPRTYFASRGLRILPGLWVCLIITAFVIAPIGVAIQGGSAANLLLSRAPIEYVLKNCAVAQLQLGVGGTPYGIPWPHQWDGSLWTLLWEVLCYIAVAVLGVVGLLNRRWLIPAAVALALLWSALIQLQALSGFGDEPPGTDGHIDPATVALILEVLAARFAVMFLAGALLYQLRHVIPARWSLVAASVVIVLAASLLPNYRVLGAIPLAYAIIVSGALLHSKRLSLRADLSYGMYIYAFPIQQLLVICGLASLNPSVFAIVAAVATLPLAAMSWFLIEKPAMSLKSRLKRKSVAAQLG